MRWRETCDMGEETTVGRRGRTVGWGAGGARGMRWLAALVVIAALGAGAARPGDVAGRQVETGEGETLDLAAMALTPADLDDAGLDGYTTSLAGWQTPEDVVAATAAGLELDEDEVEAALIDDAGLGASYFYDIDLVDPDSEEFLASARVRSYLSEHADEDGAEAGFAFREDESGLEGIEDDLEDAETFGDESEVTPFAAETTDGGAYAGLDLTLRVGRIYGGAQLLVFGEEGDDPEDLELPDLADAEALAEILVEKIEAGLDGDAAGFGLSLLAQRLGAEPGSLTYYDQYDYVDGVYAPYLGEVETAEDVAAGFEDIGATARYTLRQAFPADETPTLRDLAYTTQVYAFEDADAAETWVGDALGFLEGDSRYTEIETDGAEDDLGNLGDASAGATYEYDYGEGPVEGAVVYLAVGEYGVAMFAEAVPGIGSAALAEVAEAQAECLEDEACPDPVDAPVVGEGDADEGDGGDEADEDVTPESDEDDVAADEVTPDADDDAASGDPDDADEDTSAADDDDVTPDADEEDAANDDADTAAADDEDADDSGAARGTGEYESPNYGFVLTWDEDDWEVLFEDDDPDDAYDSVFLANGVSIMGVTGDPDYDTDDPAELVDCVGDYVGALEGGESNSEIEPLDERDAEGSEDEIAWETYSYVFTTEEGEDLEQIRYYACQVIGDGLVLVILHDASADDYEDEVAAREDLLEGLDVEDVR